MSSDLSCSDFLKARHIWTITTMVTTKSKLQMEYNKEVTSAALGLVYICVFWQFYKIIVLISNMFIYAKICNSKFVEMHGVASDIYPSALVFYTRHRVNIKIYRTVYLRKYSTNVNCHCQSKNEESKGCNYYLSDLKSDCNNGGKLL
jgi:hypothetical protein